MITHRVNNARCYHGSSGVGPELPGRQKPRFAVSSPAHAVEITAPCPLRARSEEQPRSPAATHGQNHGGAAGQGFPGQRGTAQLASQADSASSILVTRSTIAQFRACVLSQGLDVYWWSCNYMQLAAGAGRHAKPVRRAAGCVAGAYASLFKWAACAAHSRRDPRSGIMQGPSWHCCVWPRHAVYLVSGRCRCA
jgi:hypothetical protein